jgi:hypothetical protein
MHEQRGSDVGLASFDGARDFIDRIVAGLLREEALK